MSLKDLKYEDRIISLKRMRGDFREKALLLLLFVSGFSSPVQTVFKFV